MHRLWKEPHKLPDDWQFEPVRALLESMDAGSSPMCDAEPAKPEQWGVVKVSAVSWDDFDDRENKALPPTVEPNLAEQIRVGDVIASRANTTELCGAVQRVARLYTNLLLCDKTWRLNPTDQVDPDWLVSALKLANSRRQIQALATGTTDSMKNISKRDFLSVRIPTPSLCEQRRIASVIKLADDAIQRARAELLATVDLKRSLMHSLFFEGIPGHHTAFQQTSIGAIPQSWTIRTIRSVLSEKPESGTSPLSRQDPPGTPILNVSCVKEGICSAADVTYVDVTTEEISRYRAKAGDFFVLRGNGNRDIVGTGGLLLETPQVNTIYSDKLIRLRFRATEIADRFVPYLWQSQKFLRRLQSKAESGSGLWMMSKRDICREFFACPPIEEQKHIVELLDNVENQVNAQIKKVNALVGMKRSILQTLITGQIRIPEGAIHA